MLNWTFPGATKNAVARLPWLSEGQGYLGHVNSSGSENQGSVFIKFDTDTATHQEWTEAMASPLYRSQLRTVRWRLKSCK